MKLDLTFDTVSISAKIYIFLTINFSVQAMTSHFHDRKSTLHYYKSMRSKKATEKNGNPFFQVTKQNILAL